ncbi:MAG: ribbon-helix-helix domain-containing protein [Terriglobales bacterium]
MKKKAKAEGKVKVTLWLTQTQLEELSKLRADTGIPVAEAIRRAINSYLELVRKQKGGRP